MTGRTWPAHPVFADDSERLAWEALVARLRPDDVLLHGLRITDPVEGEVEIDLLLLMPDRGAAVIEVKGGHVSYADGTYRQSGADGVHDIDPAGQAARETRALCRFLEHQPTWSRDRLRAGWLVALPYTPVDGALGPQLRPGVVVGRDAMTDLAGIAYDRLGDVDLQAWVPPGDWVGAALTHLLGALDAPREVAARVAQRLERSEQLTTQQAALLSVIRAVPRFEVVGAAGTGKTWLAMEQARRWTEAGERVCLVTYTRGVVEMMRSATARLPARQRPAFVGTFFELGETWGVHPADEGPAFWTRTGPAAMRDAAAGVPLPFTAFVVDEAQDFADDWWPALLASGTADARVAVFRDDEQSVFAERAGRPDLDLVRLTLEENLRNGNQIVDTFRPLISAPVVSRAGAGFPVEYVPCSADDVVATADAQVERLLDAHGWLPEHVALLTTQHRHPVQIEQAGDKGEYWAGLWDRDFVFYSTVSGFKGLERSAVVLAVDGFHDGVDARAVLYAGMSRARDLLVVVGPPERLEPVVGGKVMRRLRRG